MLPWWQSLRHQRQSMMDTLQSLVNLNEIGVGVSKDFITQVNIVQTAINHIADEVVQYKTNLRAVLYLSTPVEFPHC